VTRYLSLNEVLELHDRLIDTSGGSKGIREINSLESSINQPRQTFDQTDLYPDIISKASILCFSLVKNHPFVDGNKRIAHASMEVFLLLNGFEITATIDEQEKIMLDLAKGDLSLQNLAFWIKNHITIAST